MPVYITGHERCAESFSIKNTTLREGPSTARTITTLKEIPRDWWTKVDNPPPGYNYRTVTEIAGYPVATLLDGDTSVSSVTEELVVGAINLARKRGIHPRHDSFPVAQFERWPVRETVTGIARGAIVELIGAAILRLKMLELGKITGPTILVCCKVFARGNSDWHGLILGASALEPAPQGLGHTVTHMAHAFEALGILMPRTEDRDGKDRKDDIYKVGHHRSHAIGLEALPCPFQDVLDPEEIPSEAQASALVYDDPEPVVLAPGEGAWLPALRPEGGWQEGDGEIRPLGASVEAVAGT